MTCTLISSGALCLVLASTIPLTYRFIPGTISTVLISVVTAEILLIQILVLRELRKRKSGEISEKFEEGFKLGNSDEVHDNFEASSLRGSLKYLLLDSYMVGS